MAPAEQLMEMHHACCIGITEADPALQFEPIGAFQRSLLLNGEHGLVWCGPLPFDRSRFPFCGSVAAVSSALDYGLLAEGSDLLIDRGLMNSQ